MERPGPDKGSEIRHRRPVRVAAAAFLVGVFFDLVVLLVQLAANLEKPADFLANPASAVIFALLPFLCAASALLALRGNRRSARDHKYVLPAAPEKTVPDSRSPMGEAETAEPHSTSPAEEARRLAEIAVREIKHPLTSIVGYSLTLRHYWDKLSEKERREFVDFIHLSSVRLEGMVNDLTRIMEISRGRARGSKAREGEVIDLEETAGEVAQILSEVHRERRVTLNLRFPREKVLVKGDPVSLFDLLYNLFDMCLRASMERSVVSAWFNLFNGKVVLRLRCPRSQFPPFRITRIISWSPEGDSDDLSALGMQYRLSRLIIQEMGGHLALSELGKDGISAQAQLPAFQPPPK